MLTAESGMAIGQLYHDHHGWLLGWLRKKMSGTDQAADLAHDTFVRLLRGPRDPASLNEPRAYLVTVAGALMVDHWRRQSIEQRYLATLEHMPEQSLPSPETRLILLETLVQIDAMLDGLPSKARTAFLLSRLEGLAYPAIAQQIGISLSSVEKYMAQAIRHCLHNQLAW